MSEEPGELQPVAKYVVYSKIEEADGSPLVLKSSVRIDGPAITFLDSAGQVLRTDTVALDTMMSSMYFYLFATQGVFQGVAMTQNGENWWLTFMGGSRTSQGEFTFDLNLQPYPPGEYKGIYSKQNVY